MIQTDLGSLILILNTPKERSLEGDLARFINPLCDDLDNLKAQFATSDAFRPNADRYGSSYLKYDIDELCYYYDKHFKGEVRFKILGTFGYKQEIMHAVLEFAAKPMPLACLERTQMCH